MTTTWKVLTAGTSVYVTAECAVCKNGCHIIPNRDGSLSVSADFLHCGTSEAIPANTRHEFNEKTGRA